MRELQTALGLVAAATGICLVPASIERFRREGVAYRRVAAGVCPARNAKPLGVANGMVSVIKREMIKPETVSRGVLSAPNRAAWSVVDERHDSTQDGRRLPYRWGRKADTPFG